MQRTSIDIPAKIKSPAKKNISSSAENTPSFATLAIIIHPPSNVQRIGMISFTAMLFLVESNACNRRKTIGKITKINITPRFTIESVFHYLTFIVEP